MLKLKNNCQNLVVLTLILGVSYTLSACGRVGNLYLETKKEVKTEENSGKDNIKTDSEISKKSPANIIKKIK